MSEVTFKSIKKRKNFRKRKASEEDEDEEEDEKKGKGEEGEGLNRSALTETLELQRLRQRAAGVSHVSLARGKKLTAVEEELAVKSEDPFKRAEGGLIDMKKLKRDAMDQMGASEAEAAAVVAARARQDDDGDGGGAGAEVSVEARFSKETRVRDEDEEMQKFIDSEMEKRRGKAAGQNAGQLGDDGTEYLTPEDRALMALPTHLSKSTFRKNEEMLSSQMLSGIPEVDLGIEEKIRNIEATEAAKQRLADRNRARRTGGGGGGGTDPANGDKADFAASNLAVNFQRGANRFRTDIDEESASAGLAASAGSADMRLTQRTVVVGDVPEEKVIAVSASASEASGDRQVRSAAGDRGRRADATKATDDLHLNKFKQHFHRK